MSTYRVIKQVNRQRRRNDVPVAAVQLGEDVFKLERIAKDLETIEPWNISDTLTQSQRDLCTDMLRTTTLLVRSWHRYAKRKLQTEYLAP